MKNRFCQVLAIFILIQNSLSAQCSPDVIAPTVICPSDVTVFSPLGTCTAVVPLPTPVASDNCPAGVTITSNAPVGDIYPLGQTIVEFTATDGAGNTATCLTKVTVNGGFPTTIVCNAEVTMQADPSGFTTVLPSDVLEGGPYNCAQTYISQVPGSPEPSIALPGTGTFPVMCWISLLSGGYNQCWGNVSILPASCFPDVTPPLAVCVGDLNLMAGPNGLVQVNWQDIDGGSSDACGPVSMSISVNGNPPSGTISLPVGVHTVALTVEDQAGLTNICLCTVTVNGMAGCSPDITPPVAVCINSLAVQSNITAQDITEIDAEVFDQGSYDACSAVQFRVTLDQNLTAPPTTSSVILNGVGSFVAALWVGDASNNWSQCLVQIDAIAPKCSPDKTSPTLIAPPDQHLTSAEYAALGIDITDAAALNTAFGVPYDWDNCDNANSSVSGTAQMENWLDGSPKKLTRTFIAYDNAGNFSTAQQIIKISPVYGFHVPGWSFPGDVVFDSLTVSEGAGYLLAKSYADEVFNAVCAQNEHVKTVRYHDVKNWFGYVSGPPTVLPALDLDNDGQTGDPYDVEVWQDSIYLLENGIRTTALGVRAELYQYEQVFRSNYLDAGTRVLKGLVFLDENADCLLDANDKLLDNWKIRAVGNNSGRVYAPFGGFTIGGSYKFFICNDDDSVTVSLDVPFNYAGNCQTSYVVELNPATITLQDIPVHLEIACPILTTDIVTNRLRPCFEDSYFVNYCNLNNDSIVGAYLEVTLDTFVQKLSTSLPAIDLGGNRYRFDVGTLQSGECGLLEIHFLLDCDAPVGLTHCSESHIFPDTLCGNTGGLWDGSDLEVSAKCVGDSVHFTIKNTGYGDMKSPVEFVVVEDMILFQSPPMVNLPAGQSQKLSFKADDKFLRIEVPQEPGHPFAGIASAFVEGCTDQSTPGQPMVFMNNTSNPAISNFCLQNVSSFDPNDKLPLPFGFGPQHFIEKNTDIEYLLRFQNTGTDVAHNVFLLDTLDASLDPTTVKPGAGSHPFSFEILNGKTLRFNFDNINLAAENVNEPASHGFVKFRISQKKDLPIGTQIENRAAIYFDFNAPIITNTTVHRIGENFISTKIDAIASQFGEINASPNPTDGSAWLELPTVTADALFTMSDQFGRTVFEQNFAGKKWQFDRHDLPAGVYFFKVKTREGSLFSGKIVMK